jgi:uncharacterized membrane protein
MGERERGSILPLLGAVLVVVVIGVLIIVEIGVRAVHRADAQTAADMAALAGLFEGRPGADDLARRNGAVLVAYEEEGEVIRVRVTVGHAEAEAAAVLDWGVEAIVENQ